MGMSFFGTANREGNGHWLKLICSCRLSPWSSDLDVDFDLRSYFKTFQILRHSHVCIQLLDSNFDNGSNMFDGVR